MNKYIVGLDIGSQGLKAVVGEVKKGGKVSLVQIFKMPSAGLRRGVVDDIPEATRAVNQILGEIKKISKNAIRNTYVSVGSPDFKVQSGMGMVAVSRADSEIYQDDIDRAVESSQAMKMPLNRMVVHSLINEFIVDGISGIRDPLGMVGNRLEVNSLLIDAFAPAIKNLTKCVESAGGSISGLIFSPLAASRAILTKNQRELGIVLVDIGFGKTGISVYEEGKLLHSAVFPVGAGNVTNDLAIGLKISTAAAENIKLSLGLALAKEAPSREQIDLSKFDPATKGTVARRYIAEIIEARLAEVFDFVNNELKYIGKSTRLPAGVVLVGGGSKLPGIVDLARQELRLSAQVSVPDVSEVYINNPELMTFSEDPEFAVAFGLLFTGIDRLKDSKSKIGGGAGEWFKKIFSVFTP